MDNIKSLTDFPYHKLSGSSFYKGGGVKIPYIH